MKRLLLDHCVPRRVRQALAGCDVATAYQRKWRELENQGQRADSRFESPPDILAKALRIADIVVKASLARHMNNLISGIERELKSRFGQSQARDARPALLSHLES